MQIKHVLLAEAQPLRLHSAFGWTLASKFGPSYVLLSWECL